MDRIFTGDALTTLKTLPAGIVHTCVTSPPYFGLRDYGVRGQIGLERTPGEFVGKLVDVLSEVYRVLRDDGTLWLNLGDSYATGPKGGHKSKPGDKNFTSKGTVDQQIRTYDYGLRSKNLIGIPWRVAFALQTAGWYLRQDIIWHKPNPMPESVTDRCTKAHEYIFLLSKSPNYYFDNEAIKEPVKDASIIRAATAVKSGGNSRCPDTRLQSGKNWHPSQGGGGRGFKGHSGNRKADGTLYVTRNRRSVWPLTTKPYKAAHFATFPPGLIEPCVLAGSPPGGIVLDPFLGSGTTAAVAKQLGRSYLGIELNPAYVRLARQRLSRTQERQ